MREWIWPHTGSTENKTNMTTIESSREVAANSVKAILLPAQNGIDDICKIQPWRTGRDLDL